MPITVLVVDDSGFFRRRVNDLLKTDSRLEVIATASNGQEAVAKTLELKPDVITMDYEMPVMNGIEAVREIMAKQPTPVLMFSSLTQEGAKITLDALEAGAVDYLAKNFEDISRNTEKMAKKLCERIITVARSRSFLSRGSSFRAASTAASTSSWQSTSTLGSSHSASTASTTSLSSGDGLSTAPPRLSLTERLKARRKESLAAKKAMQVNKVPATPAPKPKPNPKNYSLVLIGTSTGGPMALQKVLTPLPASFPRPILLIQHMPGTFTGAFAERLNSLCQIEVREAKDGDLLRPGLALLAPGGKQMLIDKSAGGKVRVIDGDARLNYKPSVDLTFGSAAQHYPGRTLGVVLTGMGSDGREGARLMRETGSVVWAQDEASSVIYGMPMAVTKAGHANEIISLADVADKLISDVI